MKLNIPFLRMREWVLFSCVLLLTACAQSPQFHKADKLPTSVNQLQSWQLRGGLSIKTPKEAFSSFLHWYQRPGQYEIKLLGPMGAGAVSLEGSRNRVIMRTADGKIDQASTPEQLLQRQLGWHLPIRQLHYWIRGLAAPTSKASISRYSDKTIKRLRQSGWVISYKRYTTIYGLVLPKKLLLDYPKKGIHAKLVISAWTL